MCGIILNIYTMHYKQCNNRIEFELCDLMGVAYNYRNIVTVLVTVHMFSLCEVTDKT